MRKCFTATNYEIKITAKKKPPIGGSSSSIRLLTKIGQIADLAWPVAARVLPDRHASLRQ